VLKLVNAHSVDYDVVKEYYDSYENKNQLNSYALKCVKEGKEKYFSMLSEYEKYSYFLIDEDNPKYIIGFGSIEDSGVFDFHEEYLNIGNLGYTIRPTERNKGYGTYLLKLLLKKCEERGMTEVCISCKSDNIASKQVILKNKGKFEKEFFDDWEGHGLKYWIKLKPKISARVKRLVQKSKSR